MCLAVLKMKMTGVILLCVTLLAVYCQGAFYISTRESNWSTASSYCTMATPPLNYRRRGYLDISGIDLQENESVWIGYYKVVRVLEYLDCVKLDVFEKGIQLQTFEIEGSPGQCFPGCGNASIVGVTLSKCFCIEENNNVKKRLKERNCTTPCLYPQGAACGSEDTNGSYVSVYKLHRNVAQFPENVPTEEEGSNCLILNRTNNRYFMWKGCSQPFEVGCYSGHQAINVKGKSVWLEAANKCFQKHLYPASYETSVTVRNNSATPLWTGHIRSQLIHKLGENSGVEDQYGKTKFGVLTKTSSGYWLTFQKDTEQRRILCQRRTSSKTKDSSNSFIVTGVMLAITAVAASIIGVAFYKKRKTRKCQQKKKRTASRDYSYAEMSLSSGPEESHQTNNYFILEPHEREVPSSDETNNDVMHLDDNLAGILDRKKCDGKENDISIEYNRLGTKQFEERRDNNIEYNRLVIRDDEKGNCVDNVYNKLSIQKSERRRDNTDEYNRLDMRDGEKGKRADNVYNRLGV